MHPVYWLCIFAGVLGILLVINIVVAYLYDRDEGGMP